MNKITVIKEVEMLKHILKGLIVSLLAILLMTFTAVPVLAFDARSGNIVTVASGEVIDGDLYVGGGTIIIDATINGDLIAAGRTITVNGPVNGSIMAAGETVNINGEVTHAVRVIGETLNISGTIGRDLLVIGRKFSMAASTAEIGGDLLLGAGTALIDGLIKGDINSGVDSLTIASTASIQGKLTYISENEANIQSGAQIRGTITHKLPNVKEKIATGIGLWSTVIGFLMILVIGIIIVLFAPKRVEAVTESIRTRPWASLGWGTVILVAIPIAVLIVCITIIGLPLGLITLALYTIVIYLTQLFVGLLIGQLIVGAFRGVVETRAALVGAMALGLAILRFLILIPFVGFFFGLATVLFGLGAILVSERKLRAEAQNIILSPEAASPND
ncbi:MAG TPA: polymer-forming cytoskeletal protein [Desulfosporosinus sp.]|nr:polymer-forming cytoskeletal protein [Desulfosporosinus sp.]